MDKRIKLFAQPASSKRLKLFSEDGSGSKVLRCQDCGYKFEIESTGTTNFPCPKCGGTRFNVVREYYSPEVSPEKVEDAIKEREEKEKDKIRLFGLTEEEEFQKEFNETEDQVELKLKEFSGSSLSAEDFEKEFSALGITAGDLTEKGFADIHEDGSVEIHEDSFIQSRLFSKLIISITKTLELDPAVTMSATPDAGVHKLEEVSDLCPKSIAIIKKVHGIGTDSNSKESWIQDSGIAGDLKLEFGGQEKSGEEFKNLLDDRYPDAPEDLTEILVGKGIIKRLGDNKFEIVK